LRQSDAAAQRCYRRKDYPVTIVAYVRQRTADNDVIQRALEQPKLLEDETAMMGSGFALTHLRQHKT